MSAAPTKDDKIACKVCGAMEHSIQLHLKKSHPEMTLEDYELTYPGEPVLSAYAEGLVAANAEKKRLEALAAQAAATPVAAEQPEVEKTAPVEMAASAAAKTPAGASVSSLVALGAVRKEPLHEVFGMPKSAEWLSSRGDAIPISVLSDGHFPDMVPSKNDTYVWEPNELKNVILALELNIPSYVWGHKGTGKSEMFEQISARTNREHFRVQHTVNTEEAHIVGMWTVKGGQTVFELGPLPLAMKYGWMYVADEYDFALPSVLSVYQAVLEGKPLVIKEADAENRVIKPHPNFRFVATGNTNGSGDDTGLYQGVSLQNSANYDRFGMVVHKQYMNKKDESQILQLRLKTAPGDADKLVQFATLIREAYDGNKISDTISPRTLIYACTIGIKRGSFIQGIELSFINKLNKVDRAVANGIAQRVFGAAKASV